MTTPHDESSLAPSNANNNNNNDNKKVSQIIHPAMPAKAVPLLLVRDAASGRAVMLMPKAPIIAKAARSSSHVESSPSSSLIVPMVTQPDRRGFIIWQRAFDAELQRMETIIRSRIMAFADACPFVVQWDMALLRRRLRLLAYLKSSSSYRSFTCKRFAVPSNAGNNNSNNGGYSNNNNNNNNNNYSHGATRDDRRKHHRNNDGNNNNNNNNNGNNNNHSTNINQPHHSSQPLQHVQQQQCQRQRRELNTGRTTTAYAFGADTGADYKPLARQNVNGQQQGHATTLEVGNVAKVTEVTEVTTVANVGMVGNVAKVGTHPAATQSYGPSTTRVVSRFFDDVMMSSTTSHDVIDNNDNGGQKVCDDDDFYDGYTDFTRRAAAITSDMTGYEERDEQKNYIHDSEGNPLDYDDTPLE
jgi:hypothetical protein